MSGYVRLVRLYWSTGKQWNYAWYETVIEIIFAVLWRLCRVTP